MAGLLFAIIVGVFASPQASANDVCPSSGGAPTARVNAKKSAMLKMSVVETIGAPIRLHAGQCCSDMSIPPNMLVWRAVFRHGSAFSPFVGCTRLEYNEAAAREALGLGLLYWDVVPFNRGERGVPWLQPWGGSAASFA
jgi:hypothetical protein